MGFVGGRQGNLSTVCPGNSFRCPIVVIVVYVRPVRLASFRILRLKSCRHVDAIFLKFFIGKFLRFRRWNGCHRHMLADRYPSGLMYDLDRSLRRFLFQTVVGSGAVAGFPPLEAEPVIESRLPLPVFAIRRGRFDTTVDCRSWALGVPGAAGLLSPEVEAAALDVPLEARNVLLTDTALNVAGFLTVDDVPACPL